mmetsp:Transcript_4447/g.10257  ORF Transcript_4447/g.10257 Transcript_4447/m.10257 type:complete len:97 (+) Transcript_4447:1353-1643(+)
MVTKSFPESDRVLLSSCLGAPSDRDQTAKFKLVGTNLHYKFTLLQHQSNVATIYWGIKLFFGALATHLVFFIHEATVSDNSWLPPPHTMLAEITNG